MLECRNLTCGYGNYEVLRNLSFACLPGKVTCLVGVNGSGKSTLLRTLAGLSVPLAGDVLLDGHTHSDYSPRAFAQKVAVLPQQHQAPPITVQALAEHGRFPWLGFSRRAGTNDRKLIESALTTSGAAPFRNKKISDLSGGEQQRAYLAMILAQDTETLLLDEPTAFLDIGHQLELMTLLRTLASDGKAVVVTMHELPLVLSYADRIMVVNDHACAFTGSSQEALETHILENVFHVRITAASAAGRTSYSCQLP